ncbi:MAG: molybdopterin oxidoreductase family protein [Deltaproteobacteria bacterium]|nr:molybdopterin oxidoreductase family protein [Deltaproteobacteria bacterium]
MKRDTVCRLCSACCPVEVDIEEGRLVSAERKSFLPPGKRLNCPKLKAAPDIVYSPVRLTRPLVKDKKGLGGAFREAKWDEALDLVAGRFKYFKDRHGPETVCWFRGMAADWGAPWDYSNRLMNAFGSPNTIGNGSVCHVARDMAHNYTYGNMTLAQPRDSGCIIIWGKNDQNTAPSACEAILYARDHGAKLIVIDPVRTGFAKMADLWLQIKPGYDGQLAMSMINEIIINGLYEREFVKRFTLGFEELKRASSLYPAEEVAERMWLTPDMIREAARVYATTKPACIIDGNGLDMQIQVFQSTRAVCMLRALTGNLDKNGGDLIPQPVPMRDIKLKEMLPKDIPPITVDYRLFNEFHKHWGLQVQSCLIDSILDRRPYPIRMLIVQSGNPAVTMTDSNRVKKALESLEFLVVIDLFMTRTAELADVILPAAGCFEETQLNRAYTRNNLVVLQNQVIDWQGESRPNWKIIFELAKRLGMEKEFPWRTAEEAINYQLAPSGITTEMLRKNPEGLCAVETEYEKFQKKGFDTPSGKVEFFSERLRTAGHMPVPFMDGRNTDPISFSGQVKEDNIIGISGEKTNLFTHTQFHNIPVLLKAEPEAYVDIHPEDGQQRGIISGDMLRIKTPRGCIRMQARLSDVVHPGSIQIAWGWGEVDPELSINNLTDDYRRDPVTGTPSNRVFMCEIEKV